MRIMHYPPDRLSRLQPATLLFVLSLIYLSACGCSTAPVEEKVETSEREAATPRESKAIAELASSSEAEGESEIDAGQSASDADGQVDVRRSQTTTAATITAEQFREAALEGDLVIVKQGLKSGLDVNQSDPQLRLTPLHMAAYNGHTEIAELLLQNDAEVDPLDHQGKTPLTHACTGPFPETVELLLENGADINLREGTEGFTPLMMAAGLGQVEVVKVLLRNDADATLFDQDNELAIDHAKNSGHAAIVRILAESAR